MKFDERFDFFEEIINRMEAGRNSTNHCDLCNTLLLELFIHICDKLQQNKFMFKKGFPNLLKFMDDTCTENLPVKFYADQIHFSEVYFIRFFKKECGTTPFKMLNEMRLEHASDLVTSTDMKICDIAMSYGYNTTSFFISEYKKRFGITPACHRLSFEKYQIGN